MRKLRYGDAIILALVWLFQAINTLAWLRLDNRFPAAGTATYLADAIRGAQVLAHPSLDLFARLAEAVSGQPPLYFVLTAPLVWLFGPGSDAATAINLAFLAVLMAATYGIARQLLLTQSEGEVEAEQGEEASHQVSPANGAETPRLAGVARWTALAAATLVSFFPLVFTYSRVYSPAFAGTALAALAVWVLLLSDRFQRRRYAVGFGLVVAAGSLTIAGFWAFILGPALIIAVQGLRMPPARKASSRRKPSRNATERLARRLPPALANVLLALLASLLALPYFLVSSQASSTPESASLSLIVQRSLLHPLSFLDDAMGSFFLVLMLVGLIYGLWQLVRPRRPAARTVFGLPLAWLLAGYALGALRMLLARTSPGATVASQVMPLLPATALLAVLWWPSLAESLRARQGGSTARVGRLLPAGLALAALLVGLVNFAVITWGVPRQAGLAAGSTPLTRDLPLLAPDRAIRHQYPPEPAKWYVAAVGDAIARDCRQTVGCDVAILACVPSYGQQAFDYYVVRTGQDAASPTLRFHALGVGRDFYTSLLDMDYLVAKTGATGCAETDPADDLATATAKALRGENLALFNEKIQSTPEFAQRFAAMRQFEPLPDGSSIQILRRTSPVLDQMDNSARVALLQHVLQVTPASNQARLALSQVLDEVGDPAQAMALREQSVARDPNDMAGRVALADFYLQNGRYQQAIGQYQAALELNPAPSANEFTGQPAAGTAQTEPNRIYLKLAEAYTALGKWNDAGDAYDKAVQIDPNDYETRLHQGLFYLERDSVADASAALLAARRLAPERPEAYIAAARADLFREDMAHAEQMFQQARKLAPTSAEPLVAFADVLLERGLMDRALELYANAADLQKDDVEARVHWIGALLEKGDDPSVAQALTLAETLVETHPNSLPALQALGDVYLAQGRTEDAAVQYQAILDLNTGDLAARLALGQALAQMGQPDAAHQVYEDGLALVAGQAELYTAEGDLALQQQDQSAAVEAYLAALDANSYHWPAAIKLSQVYLDRNQANLALDTVETMIGWRPDVFQVVALKGDIYRRLGRGEDATAAYREAISLAPRDLVTGPASEVRPARQADRALVADLHARIGEIQLEQRNFDAALTSFATALRLDPKDVRAYVGQGNAYLGLAVLEADNGAAAAAAAEPSAAASVAVSATITPSLAISLAVSPAVTSSLASSAALTPSITVSNALTSTVVTATVAAPVKPIPVLADDPERFTQASDAFQSALLFDPQNVAALAGQGDLNAAYGRLEPALEAYQAALTIDPGQPAVRRRLFDVYLAQGRTEAVVTFYRKLVRQNPKDVAAVSALADAYIAAGQTDEALSAFDVFQARNPDNVEALMAQAEMLVKVGKLEQAVNVYRHVSRIDRNLPLPYSKRADILLTLGRLNEARTMYRSAVDVINTLPGNPGPVGDLYEPFAGLVRVLFLEGKGDQAASAAEKLAAQRPDEPQVQLLVGDLNRARGRRAAAIAAYRQAVRLAPNDPVANSLLGDTLLEANKWAEAKLAYQSALAADQRNIAGMTGMARVLTHEATDPGQAASVSPEARQDSLLRARNLLSTALSLQPDAPGAQLALGDVLLALGEPQQAADIYQTVLAEQPDDPSAVESLARALLATGNTEDAIVQYESAAEAAPSARTRRQWLLALSAAYRSLGRFEEAERTYQTILEESPDQTAPRIALGDLFIAENRPEDAIAQYRQVADANPNDVRATFQLGKAYLRIADVDQADAVAQAMLANRPSAYQTYLLVARVAQARGDGAAALVAFRQAASLAPTVSSVQTQVGDGYLAAGRLDDAAAAYDAALALDRRNPDALIGRARVYARRNDTASAEAALRRALELAPTSANAQATLGRVLLAEGRATEAVPLLESAVAQQPDLSTAQQDLADAYLTLGRVDEGLAIYRSKLGLADDQQTQIVIAQALLRAGRDEDAIRAFEEYAAGRPDDPEAQIGLGQALGQLGRVDEAIQAFRRAIDADQSYAAAYILLGDRQFGLQRWDDAAASYQAAIDLYQAQPETITASEVLSTTQFQDLDATTATTSTVDNANAGVVAMPAPWRAWLGLARAYLQQGRNDEALAVAQEVEALRPDVYQVAMQVGDAYRSLGQLGEALDAYGRAANMGASSPLAFSRQGDIYLQQGKLDEAESAFESALSMSSTDSDSLEGLAQTFALRGAGASLVDFSQAETRFKQAISLAPDNANAYVALGDLYAAYGKPEDAAQQFRAALEKQPDHPTARSKLADALLAAGQSEAALAEQLKRLEEAPQDVGVLIDVAGLYRILRRYDDAEATYRQAMEIRPDDLALENSLGDLYLEQDKPQEAVSIYQKVLATADPEQDRDVVAQAEDQLSKAYVRLGQADQALATAQKLVETQPDAYRGYLAMGDTYASQGDLQAAVAAYEAGAAKIPDSALLRLRLGNAYLQLDRAPDAQKVFEQLTKDHTRQVDAFVGLARAHLAQAADLKTLRFEWANQALQIALRLDPKSVPANLALGDLMMTYERHADAIRAFETALANRTSVDDDTAIRTKLAAALEANGQTEQALQEYQRLAVANPQEIGLQMSLGNALHKSGRSDRALEQFRKINATAPDYPFAYIKQGEILDGLGQPDAALDAYKAAVAAAPSVADAQFTLAAAYRVRDMTQQAIAALEAGLALDPERQGARQALEELKGATSQPAATSQK